MPKDADFIGLPFDDDGNIIFPKKDRIKKEKKVSKL
jgi:hypothetical protein